MGRINETILFLALAGLSFSFLAFLTGKAILLLPAAFIALVILRLYVVSDDYKKRGWDT